MNRKKQWLRALVVAVGCALCGPAYGDDGIAEKSFESSSSYFRLASESKWNEDPENVPSPFAEEPLATPKPEGGIAEGPSAGCGEALDCGCVGTCCCPPERSLVASVETTFFWPQFTRSFLTSSVDSGSGPVNFASNSALGSVEGGLLVAPRITLGVQGCQWGLVTRYWYASPWASGFTSANPAGAPAGVILFDDFRAYTLDLEVQRRFCLGSWTGYGLFGARYAMVDNDRLLAATSIGADDEVTTRSYASQQFGGTGVTFGFWGIRPICCDSPLKYFVANRYSILWGSGDAATETLATAFNSGSGFASSIDGAGVGGTGDLFIAEVQFGLQWDAQLRCFPGRAFVRTGLEFQYWDTNVGLFAASESFADTGTSSAFTDASAGDLLFRLIGVNLGAGIMF
jgi:hypothetical protein